MDGGQGGLGGAAAHGRPDSGALAEFLTTDGADFDGRKGALLYFDAETRQLHQPLVPAPVPGSPGGESFQVGDPTRPADLRLGGGAYLFVGNEGSGEVSVIDAETLAVVRTVAVGARPWGVAVRPER